MWLRAAHVTLPNSWAWASKNIIKKFDWFSFNSKFIVKNFHDVFFVRSFEFHSDSMFNVDFMSTDNFDEISKTNDIDMNDIIIWLNIITVYDRFIITARNFYFIRLSNLRIGYATGCPTLGLGRAHFSVQNLTLRSFYSRFSFDNIFFKKKISWPSIIFQFFLILCHDQILK